MRQQKQPKDYEKTLFLHHSSMYVKLHGLWNTAAASPLTLSLWHVPSRATVYHGNKGDIIFFGRERDGNKGRETDTTLSNQHPGLAYHRVKCSTKEWIFERQDIRPYEVKHCWPARQYNCYCTLIYTRLSFKCNHLTRLQPLRILLCPLFLMSYRRWFHSLMQFQYTLILH